MNPALLLSLLVIATSACADAARTPPVDATTSRDSLSDHEVTPQPDVAPGDPTAPDVSPRDTTPAADVLDPATYCERAVDVFCPYYLRCGRMAAADLTACRATFLESCNARYEPTYVALAARGLLTLSAAGLTRCQTHLETVACALQRFDLDLGCDAVWVGQAPAESACGPGIESFICADDTTCVLTTSFCGTCTPLAAPGAACDLDHRCPGDGRCRDGACQPRREIGDACDDEHPCRLGSACIDARCTAPAFVAVGAACDALHACPYAAACVAGVCAAQPLLGHACTEAVGCASGRCAQGICRPLLAGGVACSASSACLSGRCAGGRCLGVDESPCIH